MKVGIAGIGGIGSNVAVPLVRYGIKALKVVDFDRVESSNLNRQFYFKDQIGAFKTEMLSVNLKRINPLLGLECINEKITPGNINTLFGDCDIVIEGLDQADEKKLLLEAFSDSPIHIISACGIAGEKMADIGIRKLKGCHIVGDFTTPLENNVLYPPKIIHIAAIMADIVITLMNDKG